MRVSSPSLHGITFQRPYNELISMSVSDGERFSVIIVNYNSGQMLLDCVQSVLQEGVPAAHVIVVDNGSRDNSIATLERQISGVRIIFNSCNAGFAAAVNQGLALAREEFILLLNNDALLQPGALHVFVEAFSANPKLAIAGGQLRSVNNVPQTSVVPSPALIRELVPGSVLRIFSSHRLEQYRLAEAPMAVPCVVGACIALRSSLLASFGPLDEDYFFYFEELEWCERARRAGFQVGYVPGAKIFHHQGKTAKVFNNRAQIEYLRSKLIFYRKQRPRPHSIIVSLYLILSALLNALTNTIFTAVTFGAHKKSRVKMKAYWYALAWHLLGRPDDWGLPEKCPRSRAT